MITVDSRAGNSYDMIILLATVKMSPTHFLARAFTLASITGFWWMLRNAPSSGQIVPDNSLGPENPVVTPAATNGLEGHRIDGGAVRGANLFRGVAISILRRTPGRL